MNFVIGLLYEKKLFNFLWKFSGRQLVGQMRNQNPEMFEAASTAAAQAQADLGGNFGGENPNGGPNPDQQPPPSS